MEWEEIKSKVKQNMSKQRFQHTLRVIKEAEKLADLYHINGKQAKQAALLHDYAKELPVDYMRQLILKKNLPKDLLDYHPAIWHGPVGAYLLENEIEIKDVEILNAVRYHTTGREGMSPLEMIIFVADYIEPERNFSGIERLRSHATINLQETVLKILINQMKYILSQGEKIYPDTLYAYNDLIPEKIF